MVHQRMRFFSWLKTKAFDRVLHMKLFEKLIQRKERWSRWEPQVALNKVVLNVNRSET